MWTTLPAAQACGEQTIEVLSHEVRSVGERHPRLDCATLAARAVRPPSVRFSSPLHGACRIGWTMICRRMDRLRDALKAAI